MAEGKARGAHHVVIACDTYDWEDYPVYVMPGETAREKADKLGSMQSVMEVYDLALDLTTQLNEHRSLHW